MAGTGFRPRQEAPERASCPLGHQWRIYTGSRAGSESSRTPVSTRPQGQAPLLPMCLRGLCCHLMPVSHQQARGPGGDWGTEGANHRPRLPDTQPGPGARRGAACPPGLSPASQALPGQTPQASPPLSHSESSLPFTDPPSPASPSSP